MTFRMCCCASGCALNPLADPGVFGATCTCWCHETPFPSRPARTEPCGELFPLDNNLHRYQPSYLDPPLDFECGEPEDAPCHATTVDSYETALNAAEHVLARIVARYRAACVARRKINHPHQRTDWRIRLDALAEVGTDVAIAFNLSVPDWSAIDIPPADAEVTP